MGPQWPGLDPCGTEAHRAEIVDLNRGSEKGCRGLQTSLFDIVLRWWMIFLCSVFPYYDIVRGNIWELVVIFGNHFLIVFPTNMHQNKRNEVGYPSPKVGEIFWMALEEIYTLEGFILPKTEKLQQNFRGYVRWKQEFASSALRNFSPNFLEGYPTQFPSFLLIDVGKKQKSWFLKPITGSQRFPLTTLFFEFNDFSIIHSNKAYQCDF